MEGAFPQHRRPHRQDVHRTFNPGQLAAARAVAQERNAIDATPGTYTDEAMDDRTIDPDGMTDHDSDRFPALEVRRGNTQSGIYEHAALPKDSAIMEYIRHDPLIVDTLIEAIAQMMDDRTGSLKDDERRQMLMDKFDLIQLAGLLEKPETPQAVSLELENPEVFWKRIEAIFKSYGISATSQTGRQADVSTKQWREPLGAQGTGSHVMQP